MTTSMLTPSLLVCPLDNGSVNNTDLHGEFYVCNLCKEILTASELVTRATHETWAAYLLGDSTDTAVENAPLALLSR